MWVGIWIIAALPPIKINIYGYRWVCSTPLGQTVQNDFGRQHLQGCNSRTNDLVRIWIGAVVELKQALGPGFFLRGNVGMSLTLKTTSGLV